jgi:hypothetical protein
VSADERDHRVTAWLLDVGPAQGPVELLDRIAHATARVPQASGSLLGRGWAWAGVIAAGATALAILVALPDGPFRSAGVPSPSADTHLETVDVQPSSTTEPSPSPTASEIAIGGTWEVAAMPDPRPEPGQGEHVRDVTAGGPGYVAVGRSYPAGDDAAYDERDWTPAIWTSVDGLSWELVPDLGALGPADLHAVASGPDGMLLALGMDLRGYGPDEEPPTDLGMWSSPDGVTWTRIPAPPNHWLIDVVATEEEWLVVGSAAGADEDGTHTVWRSVDLESWSASALPGGSDLPEPHVALVLGPDGRGLVTGCRPLPPDDRLLASCGEGGRAWVESGAGWDAVDLPFVPWATSGNGERFVSIGVTGGEWAAWTSRNGTDWERGADWQTGTFPDVMVAAGGGFIAGGTLDADGTWWPAIWQSRDGSAWTEAQRLPVAVPPQETSVYAVIEAPGGIVAMGYAYEEWAVAYRWTLPRDG